MNYYRIPLDMAHAWRAALESIPHGFGHTWEHAYTVGLTTGRPPDLHVVVSGANRVVCPLVTRAMHQWQDVTTPTGFSGFVGTGQVRAFPSIWRQVARASDYVTGYIALDPIWQEESYYPQEEARHYNDVYLLDLTRSNTELYGHLDRNRKRELRAWHKQGTSLLLDRDLLTQFLVEQHSRCLERVGASVSYQLPESAIRYLCNLPNVFLIGAGAVGQPEAVMAFIHTRHAGQALFNVSLPGGKRHTTILTWHGVQYLRELLVPVLNLGGGIRRGDAIAQAKERWGARRVPLQNLRQVYDLKAYEDACAWSSVDTNATDFFPVYQYWKRSGVHVDDVIHTNGG